MSAEFQAVRSEMLKWQDRRFDLLKHSTGVVTGLLGFKLIVEKSGLADTTAPVWPLISAILLLYLSAANLLTWYAGVANAKLGMYLKVFHDDQWESRLALLKEKGLDPQHLNRWIVVVYLVLGLVSVILPLASSGFTAPHCLSLVTLLACSIPFVLTLALVHWCSSPRKLYEDRWSQLRQDEQKST